ncbi:MAG: hypothetical protein ACI3YI_04860, partial [Bacteroidaceae bacterium]
RLCRKLTQDQGKNSISQHKESAFTKNVVNLHLLVESAYIELTGLETKNANCRWQKNRYI